MNGGGEREDAARLPLRGEREPGIGAPLDGGGQLLIEGERPVAGTSRPRGVSRVVAAQIVVIVVLAGLAMALIARGGEVDVDGGVVLDRYARHTGDGSCTASEAYSDVGNGTAVSVLDEFGDVLATTSLRSGFTQADGTCYFPFAVTDVPGGERVYGVRVAGFAAVPFDSDGLEEGPALWLENA